MMAGTENVILNISNGVRLIQLNNPRRKNAINPAIYRLITSILIEDANNDQVVATILTGSGDYFSSGNDLGAAMESFTSGDSLDVSHVTNMVDAFINYPKLIIAVVNGPAVGIASTILALCDVVYASDKATFTTPFVRLGLCAEACSSYTFPRILGRSKASEMLLLNHALTAEEALRLGFISKIIPHDQLNNFIKGLYKYGKLPPNSIKINKALILRKLKPILCECNEIEMRQLIECTQSEECSNAILEFMSKKKSKL